MIFKVSVHPSSSPHCITGHNFWRGALMGGGGVVLGTHYPVGTHRTSIPRFYLKSYSNLLVNKWTLNETFCTVILCLCCGVPFPQCYTSAPIFCLINWNWQILIHFLLYSNELFLAVKYCKATEILYSPYSYLYLLRKLEIKFGFGHGDNKQLL